MSDLEVANVVASILAAFRNGMNIFKRMTGKKTKKSVRKATSLEEELWLRESLESRPREIQIRYSQNTTKLGHKFEVGDSIAHSSLARTLLALNTGLLNLINHALSGNSKFGRNSRKSLYNLSESAARETLLALDQLENRLRLTPSVALANSLEKSEKVSKNSRKKTTRSRRPSPTPLLEKGGWVRSKSGTSYYSAAEVAKMNANRISANNRSLSVPDLSPSKRTKKEHSTDVLASQTNSQNKVKDNGGKGMREPSLLIVNSKMFDSESIDQFKTLKRREAPQDRRRPTSMATVMTASTKLGEIPTHRLCHEQVRSDGFTAQPPYILPPSAIGEESRKKTFKFWKRGPKIQPIPVY